MAANSGTPPVSGSGFFEVVSGITSFLEDVSPPLSAALLVFRGRNIVGRRVVGRWVFGGWRVIVGALDIGGGQVVAALASVVSRAPAVRAKANVKTSAATTRPASDLLRIPYPLCLL